MSVLGADRLSYLPATACASPMGELFGMSVEGPIFVPILDPSLVPAGTPTYFLSSEHSRSASVDEYLEVSPIYVAIHGPADQPVYVPVGHNSTDFDELMVPTFAEAGDRMAPVSVFAAEYVHKQLSRTQAEATLIRVANGGDTHFLIREKSADSYAISVIVNRNGREKFVHHLLERSGSDFMLDSKTPYTGALMDVVRKIIQSKYGYAKSIKVSRL